MSFDPSTLKNLSKGDIRQLLMYPTEKAIQHSRMYGDILLLAFDGALPKDELWTVLHEWVHKHGAKIEAHMDKTLFSPQMKRVMRQKGIRARPRTNHTNCTPLLRAAHTNDARAVSLLTKNKWTTNHDAIWEEAMRHESNHILDKLWEMDPPLHRLDVFLEDALWSELWIKRMLDKGVTFKDTLTKEKTRQIFYNLAGPPSYRFDFEDNNPKRNEKIKSVLATFEMIEEHQKTIIIRKTRGQKSAVKINWNNVIQALLEERTPMSIIDQLAQRQKIDLEMLTSVFVQRRYKIDTIEQYFKKISHSGKLNALKCVFQPYSADDQWALDFFHMSIKEGNNITAKDWSKLIHSDDKNRHSIHIQNILKPHLQHLLIKEVVAPLEKEKPSQAKRKM